MKGPPSGTVEAWFEQRQSHYDFRNNETYQQRYFIYDAYFNASNDTCSPIFFYTGNEANVELYLNATGLIWENAANFSALVIFAEHRYYGKSVIDEDLRYLSHEEALADYVNLIQHLK